MSGIRIFFLACLTLLFVTSCDPAKRFMKLGNDQYAVGNADGAATYYYNALLAHPGLPEAMQALQQTGNQVLTAKFFSFNRYVVANDAENAVRQYLSCKKYFNRCKTVGVDLEWASMYDPIYEDIKNDLVQKKYEAGLQLMQDKKYDQAEKLFSDIAEIDSTFKDATVLRKQSIAEPLYQQGLRRMGEENFREAYRSFKKVVELDRGYKDAAARMDEALAKATIGIGVLPVQNQTRQQGFDVRLYQQLVASLVNIKDPFLKVIDRGSLEMQLREQQLGMSGMVDPESAARAGKLIGLKYVLMTAMSDLVYEDPGPQKDSLTAYEAYTEQIPPSIPNGLPQSVTRFKKVKYLNTRYHRKLYMRVFYQMVSTQTGQVVAGDVLTEESVADNQMSVYDGNVAQLYPELPRSNVFPPKPVEFREQFNKVYDDLPSREEMTNKVCENICRKLVADVSIYFGK